MQPSEWNSKLQEAHTRWRNLETLYNEVTDPAVIDSLIYQMIVVEQEYDRLLHRMRTQPPTDSESLTP